MSAKPGYLVIQQGGSSSEFYLHAFDTTAEVEHYQRSCARASYETSDPVEVPIHLLDDPAFMDVAKALVDNLVEML